MSVISLNDMKSDEPIKGFHGKLVHSETMTLAFWEIEEGAVVPAHSHENEQILHVIEGEFELVVGGVPHRLKGGEVLIIPSHVEHYGTAITACKAMDAFHPVRKY